MQNLSNIWCCSKYIIGLVGLRFRSTTSSYAIEKRTLLRISWPTVNEMQASANLLFKNRPQGPLLKNIFTIMDGGRILCASHTILDVRNAFWEGFTQNHEVTNLFVWNFYGEIIFCALNFPGSRYDSRLVMDSGFYRPLITDRTPLGFAILADGAFPKSAADLEDKIVRARKANESSPFSCTYLKAVDILLERAMPSERQAADWGVRSLKGPFGRLTTKLPADVYSRKSSLVLCAHLYNLRVREEGMNQIRTVYSSINAHVQPWVSELLE